MKTRFSQFFAIMLLAGLLMQGCQKEPQSVDSAQQADEMAYTPKAAKLVADINSFKQKMTVCASIHI
jgi:PBP1b-binding outer membrane lipoprotein LpoB